VIVNVIGMRSPSRSRVVSTVLSYYSDTVYIREDGRIVGQVSNLVDKFGIQSGKPLIVLAEHIGPYLSHLVQKYHGLGYDVVFTTQDDGSQQVALSQLYPGHVVILNLRTGDEDELLDSDRIAHRCERAGGTVFTCTIPQAESILMEVLEL